MNQQATDAAVAVNIRVDGLELGVGDRSVYHRVHVAAGRKLNQVAHQRRNLRLGRTLKGCHLAVLTDPDGTVPPRAEVAGQQLAIGGQQAAVAPVKPVSGDRLSRPEGVQRRGHIGRHQCGVLGIEAGFLVIQVGQRDC